MATRPRVLTIPASTPFLPTLIAALLDGTLVDGFPTGGDPLSLASATIFLPTRRACRLARDRFLDVLKQDAAILPRFLPIGDIDEDELVFADAAAGLLPEQWLELPDAIGALERKLLLSRLILQWAKGIRPDKGAPLVANNPATALSLADDLARLIDDMITRGVSWDRLDTLVPDNLDRYWQLTLQFLKIARVGWPDTLAKLQKIEPAAQRDRLIEAETARLKKSVTGPVIAAGSTGSMPSTATLLATIAHLPNGAVVLPGLDTDLDAASWNLIGGEKDKQGHEKIAPAYGHPQFALHGLLQRIGIAREAVEILGTPASHGRERFVSEALRPAAATDRWSDNLADAHFADGIARAMADVTVIEAAHAEDEALGIATVLREAVEEKDKTAALITPDRALARRVVAALERWKVAVDDSGGDALADNPAGIFARLAATVALGKVEPVPLLALLKHPLCRLGGAEFAQLRATSLLEYAILRGPRPREGSVGLIHALRTFREQREKNLHHSDPRRTLSDADVDEAIALAERLAKAIAPLESFARAQPTLADLANAHRDVLTALSQEPGGKIAAFEGRDGSALERFFSDMGAHGGVVPLAPNDYPDAFHASISGIVVRRPGAPGARVRIFGPLEARLQQADRVVLGALAEGVWPPDPGTDPWLSRPMRKQLGLDLPERRIGLSAHDFAQALGAREIVLTRPAKREGAPAVSSRFLQRIAAVAGKDTWNAAVARGDNYLHLSRLLDQPKDNPQPCPRPAPKPPLEVRPTHFSVTEIESWLRDPYTIYAKRILRILPLDAVDTEPGARDRGTVIHDSLAEFTKQTTAGLPQGALEGLLAAGNVQFAALEDYPEARAFWWPRFQRIARWFIENFESQRRPKIAALHAETAGNLEFQLGERSFRLRGRADRIERLKDARYAILDYKTGQPPGQGEVRVGFAPQLPLEGAILRHGTFDGIDTGGAPPSVAEYVYVSIRGTNPPGDQIVIDLKGTTADALADETLAKLKAYAQKFEDETQGYVSLLLTMWRTRYGDYDHLARVKEWSATAGPDEEPFA